MKKYMKENECEYWAQLRSGIGDVEFNYDCWGNGIVYFQNVRYRTDILYDKVTVTGEFDRVYVKNGRGGLYFDKKDFDKYFIRIPKREF